MRISYLFLSLSLILSCNHENINSESKTNVESELDERETPEKEIQGEFSNKKQSLQPKNTRVEGTKQSIPTEKNKTEIKSSDKTNEATSTNTDHTSPDQKMIQIDFSHVYGDILKNFVSSAGNVDYKSIKTTREMLRQATMHFEENPPQSSWSKNEKLAYWINAYNLYTIELIVDNYPVKSIKDIAGGKPWDKKFIQLDGRTLSLNDIENGIIRKDFDEPRIHFAVNCASISCPKLLNKPYTAANLNAQLEAQTKRFINDRAMNTLSENSIEISNIFDWYRSDFGNVISFLNKYSEIKISPNAKISYKDYNWNLNK